MLKLIVVIVSLLFLLPSNTRFFFESASDSRSRTRGPRLICLISDIIDSREVVTYLIIYIFVGW